MQKSDPSRLYNLRCSQLPYCPRSVIFDYGLYGKYRPMDMSMAYYTSVGTTVHTVMQTFLAMTGRFLADYSCGVCGKKYPLSHKHECCDTPTQYDEVTIDVLTKKGKRGIQGHIDGIFKDKSGRYWIVDFKTTTLAGGAKKEKSPGEGYKRQIRAYAVLLRKQYNITVAGVMLVFIPRDNPRKIFIWEQILAEKDFKIALKELKADRKLHLRTMDASTVDEVLELAENKCGSPFCSYCKLGNLEVKRLAKRVVKKLPILKEGK